MDKREQLLETFHKEMIGKIVLAGCADVDNIAVPNLCRLLINCIGHYDYDFQQLNFPFVLFCTAPDATGVQILAHDALTGFVKSHAKASSNVFEIDYEGRFKRQVNKYIGDQPESQAFSKKNVGITFVIFGRGIDLYIDGIYVDNIPNASIHYRGFGFSGTELHIDEWKKILARYEKEIKAQKRFDYWASPKSQRLLKNRPEPLFQKDLAKFIEIQTKGCIVDREASVGDDRSDIKVTTVPGQDVYYFELKCLGRSEPNTDLTDDHANAGLHQTHVYVTRDERSVMGVLVVFDGREDGKSIRWLPKITSKLDGKVWMPPIQIILDHESASVAGKRIVQEAKKEAKGKGL